MKLIFRYRNWRGEDHDYAVEPESVEFGPYTNGGKRPGGEGPLEWVLHADVITRDGDPRSSMGPTRRRTFMLDGIQGMRVEQSSDTEGPLRLWWVFHEKSPQIAYTVGLDSSWLTGRPGEAPAEESTQNDLRGDPTAWERHGDYDG